VKHVHFDHDRHIARAGSRLFPGPKGQVCRIKTSPGRINKYDENDAKKALDHVRTFMELIATDLKLKEVRGAK
jgi:hypothetical protein